MNPRLLPCAVAGALVCLAACRSPAPSDGNDTLESAKATPLGKRIVETLACDDREGDCQDWFRVSTPGPGTLEVRLVLRPDEDSHPEVQLALLDAGGITLLQTRSGGRDEAGLRGRVGAGDHYVWLTPDDRSGETESGYEIQVNFEPEAGPVAESAPDGSRRGCIELVASADLNFYAGQAHVLVLYVYPLASEVGFREMSVDALLGGAVPPGMAGDMRRIMLTPGQRKPLEETFQAQAEHVGLVADYYQESGPRGSQRKLVVPARCGSGSPVVRLGPGELLQEP